MIQIETNSPETGQATSHGPRNNRTESSAEDSTDFSQVWSEFITGNAPKANAPSFGRSPIVTQSDETSPEAALDIEATEPQPEEFGLHERDGVSSSEPLDLASQKFLASEQSDPRPQDLSVMTRFLDKNQMLRGTGSNVAQVTNVVAQLAARTEGSETSIPISQIASQSGLKRVSTYDQAPDTHTAQRRTDASTIRSLDSTRAAFAAQDAAKSNGQFQPRLFDEPASLQTVAQGKDGNARQPIEGAAGRAEQIPPLVAKRPTQMQQKNNLPPHVFPPQDHSSSPKPVSNPKPLAPAKAASLPYPATPIGELTSPMSLGASENELPFSQSLQTSAAQVSTPVAHASQSNAPQVAAQIVAAVSQSSGSTTDIVLNPEELGRVRISLSNGDAGMTVNILAERAETADLMRRNIESLARELRDMGYENPSFTFGDQSGEADDAWHKEQPEPEPDIPNNVFEQATTDMHVTLTGGLDLKL